MGGEGDASLKISIRASISENSSHGIKSSSPNTLLQLEVLLTMIIFPLLEKPMLAFSAKLYNETVLLVMDLLICIAIIILFRIFFVFWYHIFPLTRKKLILSYLVFL